MDGPTPPFHVTYRFERADFVAMTHALTRTSWRWRLAATAILIAVVVIALYAMAGTIDRTWLALRAVLEGRLPVDTYVIFLIAVLFAWCGHLAGPLAAGLIFKRNALADQEVSITLDAAGIAGSGGGVQTRIAWASIKRLIETRRHLFFAISKREAVMLPRRAFRSEQDYQAARAFALQRCRTENTKP